MYRLNSIIGYGQPLTIQINEYGMHSDWMSYSLSKRDSAKVLDFQIQNNGGKLVFCFFKEKYFVVLVSFLPLKQLVYLLTKY